MTLEIRASQPGDVDVLSPRLVDLAPPLAGQVQIDQQYIGVNFIDIYFRKGLYPWPVERDLCLGVEASGVIRALGAGVSEFHIGQRVAYVATSGAYASGRNIDASSVVALPDQLDLEVAAAVMLKGLTVRYLLCDSYAVSAGDTVLFHAAAGGVGCLAGQWLKALGARAIGTAGGAQKVALAKDFGFSEVIDYSQGNVVDQVMALTDGRGVDVVYDSVGQATMADSLRCLRFHGTAVSFGQSSGAYRDFEIADLARASLYLTRPSLFHFVKDRSWLLSASDALFKKISSGDIRVPINQRFALEAAAQAQATLESRATTGCTILTVGD